jgi:hypothetical protein
VNRLLLTAAFLMGLIFSPVCFAQTPSTPAPSATGESSQVPPVVRVGELTKNGTYDPTDIPWKQVIQLGFVAIIGFTSLIIQFLMLSKAGATPGEIIKGGVLVLIITLSVSSLIFGFDDKQIAPIVGLFGTIIGFLLGKADSRSDVDNLPKATPPTARHHPE